MIGSHPACAQWKSQAARPRHLIASAEVYPSDAWFDLSQPTRVRDSDRVTSLECFSTARIAVQQMCIVENDESQTRNALGFEFKLLIL